jgi:hypothetical protein
MVVGGVHCDKVERQAVVRAGEVTTVEVDLNCAVSAGSIRGEITTESGEPFDEKSLHMWASNGEWQGSLSPERVEGSSSWKLNFEIPDVPPGDIEFTCFAGEFGTEPAKIIGRAGEFVRIRVLDRPQYIDLGFRVFDAESGAELETYDADFYRTRKDVHWPRGLRSGAIAVEHVAANGRLLWNVTSPGHLCAEGFVADQTAWAKSEGSKRWIDVHLERGWRVQCCVMASGDYEHLAGATILADGIAVGTTDADGYCTVTLPLKPKAIDARYGDWRRSEKEEMEPMEGIESCSTVYFFFERRL